MHDEKFGLDEMEKIAKISQEFAYDNEGMLFLNGSTEAKAMVFDRLTSAVIHLVADYHKFLNHTKKGKNFEDSDEMDLIRHCVAQKTEGTIHGILVVIMLMASFMSFANNGYDCEKNEERIAEAKRLYHESNPKNREYRCSVYYWFLSAYSTNNRPWDKGKKA